MKRALGSGLVVVSLLAVAAPVGAQEEPSERVGPAPVQYNFAPPGARSLAMGGAFIGLAADATASESNPAGLTILPLVLQRGLSLELAGSLRLLSARRRLPLGQQVRRLPRDGERVFGYRAFCISRGDRAALLRRLDEAAWKQTGTANATRVSVRALAFIMAGHVRHHLAILRSRYGVERA